MLNLKSFLIASLVFVSLVSDVWAGMLITPTRLVFSDRERFEVVTLVNTSSEEQVYEMSWVFLEMQSEGPAYKPVEAPPAPVDISKSLVFSPRRVELAAGEKQKIRIALRRPSDLPDGDYHVHLKIAQLPKEDARSVDGQLSATLRIDLSYTIPVIVRSGEVHVSASIGDISLERNPSTNLITVNVPVSRLGEPYSILGGLLVYYVDVKGGEALIGEVSNSHIFPEVDSRTISVQLTEEVSSEGSLKVVLVHNNDGDEDFVYAERIFPLQ